MGGTLERISAERMCLCERNWGSDGDGDFRVGGGGTLQEAVVDTLAKGLDVGRPSFSHRERPNKQTNQKKKNQKKHKQQQKKKNTPRG